MLCAWCCRPITEGLSGVRVLIAAIATLAVGSAASATVVFSDSFETDTPGTSLTALNNLSVTGTVDVVAVSNPYGIVAPSNVVDLDGTPGPGSITSGSFAFGAKQHVTLSFVLGGAQRGSISDPFSAGFTFSGATQLNNYTLGGAYGSADIGTFNTTAITTVTSIAGTSPFVTYSLAFTTGNAEALGFNIGSSSADNIGPLLDSVKLDVGAVPEPATWGLMIGGFAMVGVAARRRSSVATA